MRQNSTTLFIDDGNYWDLRDNLHTMSDNLLSSINYCRNYCKKHNYIYAAVKRGYSCSCGNVFGTFGKADISECNVNCRDRTMKSSCNGDDLLNPVESQRWYSSNYDHGAHKRPMIGSDLAWVAKYNQVGEYMGINLGENKNILGLAIQGRYNYGQWVYKIKVKYWKDGENENDNGVFANQGNDIIIPSHYGSANEYYRVFFEEGAVTARYVKIIVYGWHNHIALRAGVLENCNRPKCGSETRSNIYLAENVHHPEGECWIDSSSRDMHHLAYYHNIQINDMKLPNAHDWCRDHCKNYIYFGLQAGTHCYCGDGDSMIHGKSSQSECSTTCSDLKQDNCGGSWRNAAFAVEKVNPKGKCFYDLEGSDAEFEYETTLIGLDHCFDICKSKNYKYAAKRDDLDPGKCYCGHSYGKYGQAPCDLIDSFLINQVYELNYEIECQEGFVNQENSNFVLEEDNLIATKYAEISCHGDGTASIEKQCFPITCPLFTDSIPENSVILEDTVSIVEHERNLQEIPIKSARFNVGRSGHHGGWYLFDGERNGHSEFVHDKGGSDVQLYVELEFQGFIEEIAMYTRVDHTPYTGRFNAYTFKAIDERTENSPWNSKNFVKEQNARSYQHNGNFRHAATTGKHGTGYRYLTEKRGEKYLANNITIYGNGHHIHPTELVVFGTPFTNKNLTVKPTYLSSVLMECLTGFTLSSDGTKKDDNIFEVRCNSKGLNEIYHQDAGVTQCYPVKCNSLRQPSHSSEMIYVKNFTENYFGYGSYKLFECNEGYTSYNNDFRVDKNISATCGFDGNTLYERDDGSTDGIYDCYPVKCDTEKLANNSYYHSTPNQRWERDNRDEVLSRPNSSCSLYRPYFHPFVPIFS